MSISIRKVLVLSLLMLLGIGILGLGSAAAQSEAPAPTPAPGSPAPAAPGPAAVDKNDGRTILNGKTLTGQINPANDLDWYYFYATAGQSLTLKMTRKSGALDGYMELYGPDGAWLTADDDSGGNADPLISQFSLPQSGKFTVYLSSWNALSTGNYGLRLDVAGGDADDNRLLTSGKPLSGKILPNYDTDSYFFEATQGQKATIQMNKKGGALDSFLYLNGPNGLTLAYDDDSGGNRNALISEFTLLESGVYHIVAKSFSDSSSGAYTVRLTLTKPNYALGQPSWAWFSDEPWYSPQYGNDGDQETRWSGAYGTNWWWVDLGSRRTFNQVKINWETAYATEYFVGWSDAPECLGEYTGFYYTATAEGWKTHNLGKRTARCVGIRMDTALWWATNYSFWELEVYNLAGAAAPGTEVPSVDSILVDIVPDADFGEEHLITLELPGLSGQ